mgnify:CR=1 FL=1
MKQKLKMIWRIIRDKQVVVITEDHGRMYYNWDTRSLEDVCQMCHKVHDMAYMIWIIKSKSYEYRIHSRRFGDGK